jgi:6-phosphogluconolactonase
VDLKDKTIAACATVASVRRRRLLQNAASISALAAISAAFPTAFAATNWANRSSNSKGNRMYSYVGCRTTRERNARGDGISVYSVDQESGKLELVQLLKDQVNPSFLALSANGERLYTVHGDLSDISSYAVDKASGKIAFLNVTSQHL